MNMELFDDYFKRDYCNYIERFLCLKMKELVLLRQEIIDNSFMQEIEKEISLDVMKYVDHVDNELEHLDLRGGIFFARRLRKAGVVKADGRADGV